MTDKDLLKPYQGCETSFEKLFKEHRRNLILFARQFVKDQIIAEDIVSEVFLKFLLSDKELKCELAKKNFLYRSTRNLCYDFLREKKIREKHGKKIFSTAEEFDDSTSYQIIRKEIITNVRRILETLPPVAKRVITLAYMNGLNRMEIAQELGISPNTVRNHKAQGLKWMKERFEKFGFTDKTDYHKPWCKQGKIESMINEKIAV